MQDHSEICKKNHIQLKQLVKSINIRLFSNYFITQFILNKEMPNIPYFRLIVFALRDSEH